jgi:hypothetical protein
MCDFRAYRLGAGRVDRDHRFEMKDPGDRAPTGVFIPISVYQRLSAVSKKPNYMVGAGSPTSLTITDK